jgi:hypothetical protein
VPDSGDSVKHFFHHAPLRWLTISADLLRLTTCYQKEKPGLEPGESFLLVGVAERDSLAVLAVRGAPDPFIAEPRDPLLFSLAGVFEAHSIAPILGP